MDALSLLCTLHADGPATLQRLRSLGCQRLSSFLEFDAARLSTDLGVEPAAARRLLREGRLLADRLGHEVLEAEEAPPAATRRAAQPAMPPPPPVSNVLDDGDSALVARIMAGGAGQPDDRAVAPLEAPAEPLPLPANEPTTGSVIEPEAKEPVAAAEPEPAPLASASEDPFAAEPEVSGAEASALEPAALDDDGPVAEEPVAEQPVAEAPEPEPEPEPEPSPEPLAPDALTVGALPGLDAMMVEDLAAAGITTLGALGAAESLTLTRNLGVTFAQARRMRFLARRAADSLRSVGALESAPVAAPEPVREWTPAPPPAREPAPVAQAVEPEPAAIEPEPAAIEPEPAAAVQAPVEAEPIVEPAAEPAAEPAQEPTGEVIEQVEVVPQPQPEVRPEPRKAFWEPRAFLEDQDAVEPQGVKVDPAEIAARPRIGERFANAAQQGQLRSAPSSDGRTVLGWNFEIPRPAAEEIPLASFGANGAGAPERPQGAPLHAGDDDSAEGDEGAGPFA